MHTAKIAKGWSVLRAVAAARASGLGGAPERRATFVDIGARGGLASRWRPVAAAGMLDLCFVEPDPAEARRLIADSPGVRIIADALGAVDGAQAVLHVTREPGRSSLLRPDPVALARVESDTSPWAIEREIPLRLRRFDAVWDAAWGAPRFLKIDVQGYELEVLKGMGRLLGEVQCLELECALAPLYVAQPTLCEQYAFLSHAGFDLVRLASMGLYGGCRLVEFNAFWVRRERHADPWTELWRRVNGVGDHERAVVHGY